MWPLKMWNVQKQFYLISHFCRELSFAAIGDYALFGGHFWPKFDGREHILKNRAPVYGQATSHTATTL